MKWKWSNIPIPEIHLASLILGILLQIYIPKAIPISGLERQYLGWPIILAGLGIAVWAVAASGQMDVNSPTKILTSGPYAYSRNPMYVGWTCLLFGAALLLNNLWILLLLILAFISTHYFVILKEEQYLLEKFRKEYSDYKIKVRRYL